MKMHKAKSFINERSSEYAVVFAARREFAVMGVEAIPLYFWASREGGPVSLEQNGRVAGSLIAVFSRRPRLFGDGEGAVCWKINTELLEFADRAKAHGIPSFAALPLARNLIELNNDPLIHWTQLWDQTVGERYVTHEQGAELSLSTSEFSRLALDSAVSLGWAQMVRVMRELNASVRRSEPGFLFSGGYKPVYVICLEPERVMRK
jgi:hypothetical protein